MSFRLVSAALLLAFASGNAAIAGPRVLEWSEKTPAAPAVLPSYVSPQPMAATTPSAQSASLYPSPYGTVGDPFIRRLTWGTKRPEAPLPRPVQAAPVQPVVYAPMPERPRPTVIMPPIAPTPAMPLDIPPPPAPPKAKAKAAPIPVPAPEPQTAAEPAVPQRDGVYQIPQTSKYYKGPRAEVTEPAAPALPQPTPETNPAELPFVPGEIARDPRTQSSRVYSLHRQYGLTPDAISSVSDNAPQAEPTPQSPKKP